MNTFVPHYTRPAQDRRPSWEPRPYSENQAKFIKDLMAQKGISAEALIKVFPTRPTTFADGSKVIDWLKGIPAPHPARSSQGWATHANKAGRMQWERFALRGEDGVVKFYRIKSGRKPGYYLIDVQASDDYYPVHSKDTKAAILAQLDTEAKREAAMQLYGQEIGACSRCGRTLTDEVSRAQGKGPECINK